MISIVAVYNAVRDMANKDQKGFITPQVFNSFAAVAQRTVFSKIADRFVQANNMRLRGIDGDGKDSMVMRYKNFMSNYEKTTTLIQGTDNEKNFGTGTAVDSASIAKPSDCYHVIAVYDGDGDYGFRQFELVYDVKDMARILGSNLSAPTDEFPVALISQVIEIFPNTADAAADSVFLHYYREPTSRLIVGNSTLSAGDVDPSSQPAISINAGVPNLAASRNFDLPGDFMPDLMEEITAMVGVSLRDNYLVSRGVQTVKK